MKRSFLLLLTGLWLMPFNTNAQEGRKTQSFDLGWKFKIGNTPNGESKSLNDQNWRNVDLPHDWSIEDLPNQSEKDSIRGPFSAKSIGGTATGYVVGGTAWYRKHFISPQLQGKRVTICFDGVYMNSDVWVNGHFLGNHPYGYTPFYYDITRYLNAAGKENVIAVKVKNEGKNSRWYSGSGIYRHVWLTVVNPVHIQQWGIYVTTPQVSKDFATVRILAALENKSIAKTLVLNTRIIDKHGKTVATSRKGINLKANDTTTVEQGFKVDKPELWYTESPSLYKAVTEVLAGKRVIDRVITNFGIRSISFSAAEGFLLNGKRTLLKGGCVHHDNGPLGSAAIDRAEERKIELLKSYGFNAVRTSHNPPSPQFLDACDRLGMLVIDEAFDQWQRPKNPEDYHLYFNNWWKKDLSAMVLRDRSHPSVIIWSIGNEINERADSSGIAIAKQLVNRVHQLDDTRPVSEAICDFWDHKGYKWDTTATAFSLLNIGGYNYMWQHYETDHQLYPERIMVGTESFPLQALENWQQVQGHPWVIGDFVWTAMDYMGETGIGHTNINGSNSFSMPWPWYNAYCGDIDLIGDKKPQSWYRDVVWGQKKIAMLVHMPLPEGAKETVSYWGWPDEYATWNFKDQGSKPLQVNVYSAGFSKIRLLLNGKKIDEQSVSKTGITTTFNVKYQPGELKALGILNKQIVDSAVLQTTGVPYQVRLIADRGQIKASRNDLSYIKAEVVDAEGRVVPDAAMPVQFEIAGNGQIIATGNANPADMSSFKAMEKKTFRGRCLAIVRPQEKAGVITVTARSEGLIPGSIQINVH